ncbi:MAG: type II secretion system F family protein [Lachnospiraceae bacterium]|nr:type II secretion system F family protein [Lachnospiraceae bacterium]
MPSYKYTAYTKEGKEKKGSIEADDKDAAAKLIKAEGNTPIKIEEEGLMDKDLNFSFGGKKASSRDLSIFCRQFVSISKAGVSIVDALEMLADQTENKELQKAIYDTMTSVQKGETLAVSMKKQGKIFPSLLINMVEAGEASGNLDVAFDRMATQFEKDTRLKSMVKKAMIYPAALSVVIVGVIIIMMAFVVPTFSDMYADMGQKLPTITLVVVGMSNFVVDKWYVLIVVAAVLIIGFKVFKSTEQGTYILADLAIKAPIFGKMTVKSAAATFARTLSTLTAAGISMIEALEITGKTMKNVRFRDELFNAKDKVAQGRPLSEPLKAGGLFPNMIVHMIGIGEETGNLEDMLLTAAGYYEEEVEVTTESISTVVEPMIICVMAGIVGVIIMAVLIPMFGMYSLAGGGEV